MALPRSKYVREGEIAAYHCTTRCVRRAFLYGFDAYSGRDYSHRKTWIRNRLQFLSSIFAIDVLSFSVMDNHYHVNLRTRPDIVDAWSDYEVASRWLTLCPNRYRSKKKSPPSIDEQIRFLANRSDRIALLRKRLSSLSWFMGRLNENIARAANKEDKVKGRFWESRFKCQVLLDDAAIAACMVYVDLNPIRAGVADTPEESDFTSIQLRIHAWQTTPSSVSATTSEHSPCWLCPISSENNPNGILPMTDAEYFDMVDRSGRLVRAGRKGAIDAELAPILLRIGAKPEVWPDTVSRFEDNFSLVAGQSSSLRNFADRLGRRWFTGVSAARTAFDPKL